MNDNKTSKNSIVAKFAVPISFLILFFLAANFTDCDLVTFWKRRNHLTDLVVDMIPPDFSYIQKILLPLFYTIHLFCPCTLAFWRCKLRISSCNTTDT